MKKLVMIISAALLIASCGGEDCKKDGACCKDGDKKECHKDGEHHGDMEHHGEHHEASDSTDEMGLTDEDYAVGAAVHTILKK